MEKHHCKLCARRFGSGRALGGHMRSHFTILPVPPKPHPSQLSETETSSSSSYVLCGSRKKRRSSEFGQAAVSSETSSSEEEDLAMWLMLLSRDKWVRKECPAGIRREKVYLENGTGGGGDDEKLHECPVCYKVFKSGQALGGHKRSHLFSSTSTAASANNTVWLIDLNLPAPMEDGGDMSHSHVPVLC
uniref:C2H2-type domain-containing protein n=1 Tax=Kalanchoe fedtschenkoi TaxID=63787 RepID=A0A7N0TZV9_KALFE